MVDARKVIRLSIIRILRVCLRALKEILHCPNLSPATPPLDSTLPPFPRSYLLLLRFRSPSSHLVHDSRFRRISVLLFTPRHIFSIVCTRRKIYGLTTALVTNTRVLHIQLINDLINYSVILLQIKPDFSWPSSFNYDNYKIIYYKLYTYINSTCIQKCR